MQSLDGSKEISMDAFFQALEETDLLGDLSEPLKEQVKPLDAPEEPQLYIPLSASGKGMQHASTQNQVMPSLKSIMMTPVCSNIPGTVLTQNSTMPPVNILDMPLGDLSGTCSMDQDLFDQIKSTASSQMTNVTDTPKASFSSDQKTTISASKMTVLNEDGQIMTLNNNQTINEGQMTNQYGGHLKTLSDTQSLYGSQMTTPKGVQILYVDQVTISSDAQSLYGGQMTTSSGDQSLDGDQITTLSGDQSLYGGEMTTSSGYHNLCGGQMIISSDAQSLNGSQMTTSSGDQSLSVGQITTSNDAQSLYGDQMTMSSGYHNLYGGQMTTSSGDQSLYGSQMMTFNGDHTLYRSQRTAFTDNLTLYGGRTISHPSSSFPYPEFLDFSDSHLIQGAPDEKWKPKAHGYKRSRFQKKPGILKFHTCKYQDCGKSFSKASYVQIHERIHTGERPYSCDVEGCTWKFYRADELSRHKRKHSGERPYLCTQCDRSFARSDHLKQHQKLHR